MVKKRIGRVTSAPPARAPSFETGDLARLGVAGTVLPRGSLVRLGARTPSGRFEVAPARAIVGDPRREVIDATDLLPAHDRDSRVT